MSGYIHEDPSYFDGLDLENSKPIKHPLIEKLQTNAKTHQSPNHQLLDDDIADWLIHQDMATKHHINALIRHAMALKLAKA